MRLCKTAHYLLIPVPCGRTTSSQKPTVATECPSAQSGSWTPGGAVPRALWLATSSRTHMSSTSPCWTASANPGTGLLPPACQAAPPLPPAPSLSPQPPKVGPAGVWYLCTVAPVKCCAMPSRVLLPLRACALCDPLCIPLCYPFPSPCTIPCVPSHPTP